MADAETRKLWDELSLGYTKFPATRCCGRKFLSSTGGFSRRIAWSGVPQEGILMALNCLLQPGEHVICTFPGYQSLYSIAEGLGCEVTRWVPEEENGWRFNPALLEQHIRPNTRLLIINFPHNPTGSLPAIQDYRQIIDFARRHGLYLFSDEMYRLLEQAPEERLPAACEELRESHQPVGGVKNPGAGRGQDRLAGYKGRRTHQAAGRVQGLHHHLQQCTG